MTTSASRRGEKLQIHAEVIANIRELISASGNIKATARAVGVTPPTVRKYARDILDEMKSNGFVNLATPSISMEAVAQIEEALKTAESINGAARRLGLSHTTVRRHAKRFITQMRQAGTLGLCACGRERFHPEFCASRMFGAPSPGDESPRLRRRSLIVEALKDGLQFAEIGRRFGILPKNVKKYYRHMSEEEIQARLDLQSRQRSKKKVADHSERFVFRPHKDPV